MAFREEERDLQLRREMGLEAHMSRRGRVGAVERERGREGWGRTRLEMERQVGCIVDRETGRTYYVYLARLGCHHPSAEQCGCGKLIELVKTRLAQYRKI